jgi:hypothetical protein
MLSNHDMNMRCHHGVPLADADECDDCLALEAAKIRTLASLTAEVMNLTDADDSATRALFLTAAGRYVSMKMHKPADAPKVLHALKGILREQLPCAPEERLQQQALLLTSMSFSAHEPETGAGRLENTGIELFRPSTWWRIKQFFRGVFA